MDIFTTDYQPRTAEMVVVETLWQLHTLIVINYILDLLNLHCRLK